MFPKNFLPIKSKKYQLATIGTNPALISNAIPTPKNINYYTNFNQFHFPLIFSLFKYKKVHVPCLSVFIYSPEYLLYLDLFIYYIYIYSQNIYYIYIYYY